MRRAGSAQVSLRPRERSMATTSAGRAKGAGVGSSARRGRPIASKKCSSPGARPPRAGPVPRRSRSGSRAGRRSRGSRPCRARAGGSPRRRPRVPGRGSRSGARPGRRASAPGCDRPARWSGSPSTSRRSVSPRGEEPGPRARWRGPAASRTARRRAGRRRRGLVPRLAGTLTRSSGASSLLALSLPRFPVPEGVDVRRGRASRKKDSRGPKSRSRSGQRAGVRGRIASRGVTCRR